MGSRLDWSSSRVAVSVSTSLDRLRTSLGSFAFGVAPDDYLGRVRPFPQRILLALLRGCLVQDRLGILTLLAAVSYRDGGCGEALVGRLVPQVHSLRLSISDVGYY